MKEYSGILYMRHFTTKNLVISSHPVIVDSRYHGHQITVSKVGRYNESGIYIFEEHLNCTQVTIKFQHESLTNCGQKFFCLQTRRIDISPPLLDKLRITATNS